MDEIVRQALAKWPNVPDCYGWLGLDARGQWFMRDDGVQAAGPFAQHKGSLLRHDKLIDFILQFLDRLMPVFIVKQYQGGAFFRMGKFRSVKGPGFHWKIPLFDDVDMYDVVTTTLTLPALGGASSIAGQKAG